MLLAIFVMLSTASGAVGYGTSSIAITPGSLSIIAGGAASAIYNVTVASGNTWGTTVNIVDKAQLASQGITATLSNPGPVDPPFSGTLAITASASAKPGTYTVTLNATGDDPSVANANLTVNLAAPSGSKNSTSTPTTTSATTTVGQSSGGTQVSGFQLSGLNIYLMAGIILVLMGAIAGMSREKDRPGRMIIAGIAIILLSTIFWLYADYSGGIMAYIWASVAGILIGVGIWLVGDWKGSKAGRKLIALGTALIILGLIIWLYGDYTGGNLAFIWGGAALIIAGIIVWFYGDRKEHLI